MSSMIDLYFFTALRLSLSAGGHRFKIGDHLLGDQTVTIW